MEGTMKSLYIPLMVLVVLSGCGGGSDKSTATSVLNGTWITQSCDQAKDSNGSPLILWVKGIFEFTNSGTLLLANESYSDSNCITLISKSSLSSPPTVSITFQDTGFQFLQEGIDGGGLNITIDTGTQQTTVNGFYTVNNNSLCFSDSFTFGARSFGVSEIGSSAINFTACLEKT